MVPKEYYGRLFTKEQLSVISLRGFYIRKHDKRSINNLDVKRCYSQIEEDWQLPNGQYYCRACIVFGRNQEGKELYYFPSEKFKKVDFTCLEMVRKLDSLSK